MFNDYFCKNLINDLFKYDSVFILFIYVIIFFYRILGCNIMLIFRGVG